MKEKLQVVRLGPGVKRRTFPPSSRLQKIKIFLVFILFLLLLWLKFQIFLGEPHHESPSPLDPAFIRLPRSLRPESAWLDWTVSPEGGWFNGTVKHQVFVMEPTTNVVLHAVDLKTAEYSIICDFYPAVEMDLAALPESQYADALHLKLDFVLHANQLCNISISFYGKLETRYSWGFFRQEYRNPFTNLTEFVVATHFEPTGARQAFPCFDEPDLKSSFHITVTTISNTRDYSIVLSNAKEIESPSSTTITTTKAPNNNNDSTTVFVTKHSFEKTPRMSSYLVAAVITSQEKIQATTQDGILVAVYFQPGSKAQAEFALKVALHTLPFFSNYFAARYPLLKLDIVPVPFFSGEAMENFGLNIFDNTLLMFDESVNSAFEQEYTSTLVAHEIAHQWFGNLVTMSWWDSLWLNEGFAEYLQYLGGYIPDIGVDFDRDATFFLIEHLVAFAADSSNFTHSIALKTPENDPSKIAALFDDITYNKGASVIRMLESWMEVKKPGTFSSGLQSYIQRYKYGNARTEDLWRALDLAYDGASGGNVIENIMDTWIFQPGYPIVTAKWHMHPNQSTSSSSDSSDAAVLELSQAPFDLRRLETDLSCNDHNNVNNKSTWIIPFTYLLVCRVPSTIMLSSSLPSSSSPSTIRHSITLEESKVNLTLTLCDDGTSPLFLANPSRTGFYKTIYPVDILQSLFDGMGFNRDAFLGAADRLGLITDTVSHLLSRYHSTSFTHPSDENNTINVVGTYLKCLQLMRQEMDELVWTGFLEFAWAPLNSAMIHLSSDVPEVYTGFVKFGQGIVDHWISYVQWDPLDGVKQRSRVLKGQFWIVPSDVIEFAVLVGNPQAVNRALGVFEKLVDGSLSSLPPVSVVDAVLLAGVIYQDDGYHQLYELLFKQDHDGNYDPSIVKLPPDSIFTALCKSQREEDQKKTLHLIQKLLKQMSGDGGGGGDDRVGKNNKTAVASVTPVTIIHGIRYISQASRTAPHLVWKFLAKMLLNDEHISFPIMSSKMAKVVEDTIGRMGSDGVKEVEALIDKLGGGKEHHPDTVDRILIILKRGVERANAVLSFANSTWGIETADFFKTLNFY